MLLMEDEIIWGILVCRLKLDRSLSSKTLLAAPALSAL